MMWRGSLLVTILMAVPAAIGVLQAQTLPPPPAYTYDVVSIHRSDPAEVNVRVSEGPQGGLRTINTSALHLIAAAYKVNEYQIADAPHWADAEHFDVMFTPDKAEATPVADALPKEWDGFFSRNLQRLQAVLRDRFGLVLRAETRELPIYVLTRAKGSEKLARQPDDKPGASIATNGDRQIRGRNATMEMLAGQLAWQLNRPVHDETHIDGHYDFKLDWIPEPGLPDGNIFTAINEQLGLRLEAGKGPVQVYVVEKIEQPSEN